MNLIPTSLQFRLPTLTTGAKQVIADQLNYNALDFDVFEFDSIWGRPKMTTATRIEDLQVSVVNSNINLKVGIVPNALLTESKIEVQSSNINFEVRRMDKHILVATEASFLNSKVNILINNEEAEGAPIKSVVNLRHKFSNLYSVVDIGLVNTMNFYIKANTGTIKEEFFRVTSNSKVDLI